MELRHIRYFVALADCLNFTHAAEKVHVTQSTLSHQIKKLEEELEVQLFERKARKVFLTEAGETFLNYASQALQNIDQGIWKLKKSSAELTGQLKIGATQSFCSGLIPSCLAIFSPKYPEVKSIILELSGSVINAGLRSGELDIGVSYRPEDLDDLWFEPLYNEEMVLIVSNNHPLAKRKRIRMVELQSQQLALLTQDFSTRKMLDEYFVAANIEPIVVAETNSIAPLLELVRMTEICSIVSENAITDNKGLNVISIEGPTPVRTPGLIWNRNEAQSPVVSSFAAIIRRSIINSDLKAP